MLVIFTDLDGTLLDDETYSWEAARPALELLSRREIPLVFCTSKTRAEVEVYRTSLRNPHPFIVENGAAVFVPPDYFPFPVDSSVRRDSYDVVEFGDRYSDLVDALHTASAASGAAVLGFHQMTASEVAARCSLPLQEAVLAKQREYDEPFQILDPAGETQLLREIERLGKRWTRGGRFYHITGKNDKAGAVRFLTELYGRVHQAITTVGLGDGLNDAPFLAVVDVPVLIRSPQARDLQEKVPHGRLTDRPGPEGWNQAILEVVQE